MADSIKGEEVGKIGQWAIYGIIKTLKGGRGRREDFYYCKHIRACAQQEAVPEEAGGVGISTKTLGGFGQFGKLPLRPTAEHNVGTQGWV